MPTDLPAAARRVAEQARALPQTVVHAGVLVADLCVLLPLLDAAAAGLGDDRVERWALMVAAVGGSTAPNGQVFVDVQDAARAAIALADAERAAAADERWVAYEAALTAFQRAANSLWTSNRKTEASAAKAAATTRAALDAAVRGVAGVP